MYTHTRTSVASFRTSTLDNGKNTRSKTSINKYKHRSLQYKRYPFSTCRCGSSRWRSSIWPGSKASQLRYQKLTNSQSQKFVDESGQASDFWFVSETWDWFGLLIFSFKKKRWNIPRAPFERMGNSAKSQSPAPKRWPKPKLAATATGTTWDAHCMNFYCPLHWKHSSSRFGVWLSYIS